MVTILNVEEINELQSQEEFDKDIYYAPRVDAWVEIEYRVKGIKLKTKIHRGVGRLPIYGQTVSSWVKDHLKSSSELTPEVIAKAMKSTSDRIVSSSVNGKVLTSRNDYLYQGKKSNTLAYKTYLMSKSRFDKGYRNFFVKELDKKRGIPLKDYEYAYLYRHTGKSIQYEDLKTIDVKQSAKDDLSYRIIQVFEDKEQERELNTFEDALEYIQYLCEDFDMCYTKASEIVKDVKLSHQIWDLLSTDEIKEIIEMIPEEDRDWIDLDSLGDYK